VDPERCRRVDRAIDLALAGLSLVAVALVVASIVAVLAS
jgi:hypothetical protein